MSSTVIKVDSQAQAHIQAYLEYKNIVGDTDGGVLLSEEEYIKRKKKAAEDQKNRVYVTWLNDNGLECRAIGPSSKCFCGHKFRDHDSCNKQKNVHCKMAKCKCRLFEYIPIRGSQDLKCHCKHSYKFHNTSNKRNCTKKHSVKGTCQCQGFISSFGCPCGQPFSSHYTLFETRSERQKAGKRVDNVAMGSGMGCVAMGGITTFSSLLDGVDRMSIQSNNHVITKDDRCLLDLGIQYMRPKKKLSESDEMALYAKKYQKKSLSYPSNDNNLPQHNRGYNGNTRITQSNKSMNMPNSLKLLKNKRRHSVPINAKQSELKEESIEEYVDFAVYESQRKIIDIEKQLKDSSLSAPKKYALNKSLKMEKSKIIRHQRKKAQAKKTI